MKTLVVYFSRVGENSVRGEIEVIKKGYTEIVAEKIAKKLNCELYKLEPIEPYPFSYKECVARAKDEGFVPYHKKFDNLDAYDTIFLGFPNWWRSYPGIIASFLRDYDFVGKTIIPFCTNEEGAFGIGELELRTSVKGANIKNGFACRGYDASTCDEALEEYLSRVL